MDPITTFEAAKGITLTGLQLAGIITGSVVIGVGVGYVAHAVVIDVRKRGAKMSASIGSQKPSAAVAPTTQE